MMHVVNFISIGLPVVSAHGYIANPISKNGGDELVYATGTGGIRYTTASYWVDRASSDGNYPGAAPWKQPGKFDWDMAKALPNGNAAKSMHPCGQAISAAEMKYAKVISIGAAQGWGKTLTYAGEEGPEITPPQWKIGQSEDVAFFMHANHEGGYIYSLCAYDEYEKCFAHDVQSDDFVHCAWDCFKAIDFEPNSQRLQYANQSQHFVRLDAKTKDSAGTYAAGSQWREIPIPDQNSCSDKKINDYVIDFSTDFVKAQFDNTLGANLGEHWGGFWHIYDEVKIPSGLPAGRYLLGWRWDCDCGLQMWNNCADVELVSSPTPNSLI